MDGLSRGAYMLPPAIPAAGTRETYQLIAVGGPLRQHTGGTDPWPLDAGAVEEACRFLCNGWAVEIALNEAEFFELRGLLAMRGIA